MIDGLLRRRLGFEGVVVTDDLGAQALVAGRESTRPRRRWAPRAPAPTCCCSRSPTARRRATRCGERCDAASSIASALIASCARSTALRERFASGAEPLRLA